MYMHASIARVCMRGRTQLRIDTGETMKKMLALLVIALAAGPLFAQATALGAPIATVRLTKTEIIYDSSFRADVAKVEKLRGSPLSEEERKAFLDDVMNDLLFFQFCARDGITVADSEVESYIAKVRSQLGPSVTDAQFEAYLTSQDIMLADLRSYYRKQILVQRWLTKDKAAEIAAMPKITGSDIMSVYELYKSKLVRPDTARVAFLFVAFKDKTAEDKARSAAEAKALVTRLEKGESFDALRLGAVDGGSYNASRDYFFFERSEAYLKQFGSRFYDTVFALKDGSYSAPFETDNGWWIVRRAEFFPQKTLELSDPVKLGQATTVEAYLSQLLAQQRESEFIQKAFAELFTKLRSQADIKILGKP